MAKTEIVICMGSACFARGNAQNLEFLSDYISENNLDAKIEIAGSRCEGKCADGPNMTVNGVEYNNVDRGKILTILKEIEDEN